MDFQLKTGDFGQAEISKHHDQLRMLVEARPIHPGLLASFEYRPFLVTTGEFKEPAVSLVRELNAGWQHRKLPPLSLINGRQLHVDFVSLSSDFWPVEAPAVRRFRELYLVDGRGDLDRPQFAALLIEILRGAKSGMDLDRRVAAANLFASYLLGEFYRHEDHWSVFQGWTVAASQIAWAGESTGYGAAHWQSGFDFAKGAGSLALKSLASEVLGKNAFRVGERELDDFTRTRNTVALAGNAAWQLTSDPDTRSTDDFRRSVELTADLLRRERIFFWGEGAFSQLLVILWVLECGNQIAAAKSLLTALIKGVAEANAREGKNPFEDPYSSPDEVLAKLLGRARSVAHSRRAAVESYTLLPLVWLAARRDFRTELEQAWRKISHVDLTWFRPEKPSDVLLWHCHKGDEYQAIFPPEQSWKELREAAFRDDTDRLPQVLREDTTFGIMFMLGFPHRILPSLVKHLDGHFAGGGNEAD